MSGWAIRLSALAYVPFRRSPEAAKGWLLLFFVAPWAALVIYLFIGRARHPRWRRERVARLPEVIGAAMGNARSALEQRIYDLPPRSDPIADLGEAIGRLPPLAGNAVELEGEYDGFVTRLEADIDAARAHVHLAFYIFAADATGTRILAALERAAARGVACRLLADAYGSRGSSRAIARRLEGTGVELRFALPLRLGGRATRADMRNHRKLAVIDGRVGWVGSQNMVGPRGASAARNVELMARVTGPVVAEMGIVFLGDWYLETESEPGAPGLFPVPEGADGGGPAQIVASGPDNPPGRIDMLFVALIEWARTRVSIVTPYFVPSEPLLFALRSAALRGVEVQLIVSERTDSRLLDLAQSSYYTELMETGVHVALFRDGFLHAKLMRADDAITLIGSSNMDMRSFELNSEVTLVSYDAGVARRVGAVEAGLLGRSRKLDLEAWRKRAFPAKLAAHIARLFSPLL